MKSNIWNIKHKVEIVHLPKIKNVKFTPLSSKKFFFCYKCGFTVNAIVKKKINQRKYQISCLDCKTTKTLIIPLASELCEKCNGTGLVHVEESEKNMLNNTIELCSQCKGKGIKNWIDKILR